MGTEASLRAFSTYQFKRIKLSKKTFCSSKLGVAKVSLRSAAFVYQVQKSARSPRPVHQENL